MGHYDGMTVEQTDALRKANKLGLKEAFFLDWLELFRCLGPEMAPQTEGAGGLPWGRPPTPVRQRRPASVPSRWPGRRSRA